MLCFLDLNKLDINKYFEYGLIDTLIAFSIFIICAIIINKVLTRLMIKKLKSVDMIFTIKTIIIYSICAYNCAVLIIPLKNVAISLIASSGFLVLILGLAAQEAVGNLVAGVFIIIFKPFQIGDLVSFPNENIQGYVEDVTLRHTTILTFENTKIEMPNSICNKTIIENLSKTIGNKGNLLVMNISYSSNIAKAISIMKEEILNHPNFIDQRSKKEIKDNKDAVTIRVSSFLDSSIELKTYIASKDHTLGLDMLSDLRQSIKTKFDKNGIDIPFNQLVVHTK